MKKQLEVTLNVKAISNLVSDELKNKKLKKAALEVRKEVERHFKKHKWDLNYSFLIADVFYKAFGIHLEDYLIKELGKSKLNYCLKYKGETCVLSIDKKKRNSKK